MEDSPFQNVANPAPRNRGLWVILVCVVLVGGGWALSHWTHDVQFDPPRLQGSVWTAIVADAPRLYFVTEEQRGERGYFDTDLMHSYTITYSLFALHARNAHNGASAGSTQIARIDTATPDPKKFQINVTTISQQPEILGNQGAVLWLWNNGLEARNLDTLAPLWTPARVKELNPEFAPLLPADRQYYKFIGKLQALVFKGQDARYFQIDPADAKIQPLDNAVLAALSQEYTKTADSAFASLHADSASLWSTSVGGLMWNSLTDNGTWYALLTTEERASLTRRPGNGGNPWGEVARALFRGNFELEYRQALGENHILLNLDSVTPVGSERFLMGGFLRRPNAGNLWPLDGGKSYLVLHRKVLGENSPWHLTRLGLDGKIHWTRSTGLGDLQHVCDGHGTAVFTGFADHSQPTAKRPDLMVFIDELTGQSRTLNVVSGEIVVGA